MLPYGARYTVFFLLLVFCCRAADDKKAPPGIVVPIDNTTPDPNKPPTDETDKPPKNLPPNPNDPKAVQMRGSTCKAFAAPLAQQGELALVPTFGSLKLYGAVAMVQTSKSSSYWFVAQQQGVVLVVPNQSDVQSQQLKVALDISKEIYNTNEAGLLGMTADPTGQYIYLFYTMPGTIGTFKVESQVVRYPILPDNSLDSSNKRIVWRMHSPYDFHLGGDLHFGADGLLYIGIGMGSTENDPARFAQNMRSWRGKVLRIDVRNLSNNTPPYTIPPNNPFVSNGAALPEIFALGLRNAWRWSIDQSTNNIWLGDVGANQVEEINLITAGGNYGFPFKEGKQCNTVGGATAQECATPNLLDPIASYDHTQGRCVVGGFVYRGNNIPALKGTYIYADCLSGKIWQIPGLATASTPTLLLQAESGVLSFAQGNNNELAILTRTGSVFSLRNTASMMPTSNEVPKTLKQTNCFQGPYLNEPVAGVLPYSINIPFWSDGATKQRFFAMPEQGNLSLDGNQHIVAPIGTVFLKQFYQDGKPYPFETRLWIRHDETVWRGYTYRWDEASQDALLVAETGETRDLGNGVTWSYPSQAACQTCHSGGNRSALGWEVGQLNKTVAFADGTQGNQLAAFAAYNLLPLSPTELSQLPSGFPELNTSSLSPSERAKLYLHVNCSSCHRPEGTATGNLDFSLGNSQLLGQLCLQPASNGTFELPGGVLLKPGEPSNSVLAYRMRATNGARMPAISSGIVDSQGVAWIDAWIQATTSCPSR